MENCGKKIEIGTIILPSEIETYMTAEKGKIIFSNLFFCY